MEQNYLLTTIDNPFNPFVDFTSWYMFDCEKGYNTSSRIARIANISPEMTQKEIDEETDRAMNLIVKYDFEDKYLKGTEEQIEKILKNQENILKSEEDSEKVDENDKTKEKQTATAKNA